MSVGSPGSALPWWAKIAAKIVFSRLPTGYALWQRLGSFRHGAMDDAGYACSVFESHVRASGLHGELAGRRILELGPGDSVATAVIASAHGARAVLVDAGRFAQAAPASYAGLVAHLRERGLEAPDISRCRDLDELLAACGARYLTGGLRSLQGIESSSVDLIFSQAVLEHVRRNEFLQTQRECARILSAGGVCSHRVDLRDHLDGRLNNLRFPERVWESAFFVNSGFYTNRIQFDAMLAMFEQAGFAVHVSEVRRWESLPIARAKLAAAFRGIPDRTLSVCGFDVVLRHAVEARA